MAGKTGAPFQIMPDFIPSNRCQNRIKSSTSEKSFSIVLLPLMILVVLIYANTLPAPYFFDDEINRLLEIDGEDETALYLITAGKM